MVYKDEKRGTWYVNFKYRVANGQMKGTTKRGFKTKREAMRYEVETRVKAEEQAKQGKQIEELVEGYLMEKKGEVKASTYRNTELLMWKYMVEKLGEKRVGEIDEQMMKMWQKEMISSGLKGSSIRRVRRLINNFFSYLIENNEMKENPLKRVKQVKVIKKEAVIWSREEFERAIKYVRSEEKGLALEVLYYSGMRIGELLALEGGDVKGKRIKINKSKMRVNGEVSSPKSETSKREIEMPAGVMNKLRGYISGKGSGRIFQMSEDSLLAEMRYISKEAGLERLKLHELRHSHASYLLKLGVPISVISKRLGHANARITLEVYSHMIEGGDEEAVKKMEEDTGKKKVE